MAFYDNTYAEVNNVERHCECGANKMAAVG